MNTFKLKSITKTLSYGLMWLGISLFVALIIKNTLNFSMSDVLFLEGLGLLIITGLSSVSGDPIGLGLQSYQLKHPFDIEEKNYDINPNEKGNLNIVLKKSVLFSTTAAPLFIGGILTILTNYVF